MPLRSGREHPGDGRRRFLIGVEEALLGVLDYLHLFSLLKCVWQSNDILLHRRFEVAESATHSVPAHVTRTKTAH